MLIKYMAIDTDSSVTKWVLFCPWSQQSVELLPETNNFFLKWQHEKVLCWEKSFLYSHCLCYWFNVVNSNMLHYYIRTSLNDSCNNSYLIYQVENGRLHSPALWTDDDVMYFLGNVLRLAADAASFCPAHQRPCAAAHPERTTGENCFRFYSSQPDCVWAHFISSFYLALPADGPINMCLLEDVSVRQFIVPDCSAAGAELPLRRALSGNHPSSDFHPV